VFIHRSNIEVSNTNALIRLASRTLSHILLFTSLKQDSEDSYGSGIDLRDNNSDFSDEGSGKFGNNGFNRSVGNEKNALNNSTFQVKHHQQAHRFNNCVTLSLMLRCFQSLGRTLSNTYEDRKANQVSDPYVVHDLYTRDDLNYTQINI
jgi:hypothetical protein